MKCYICSKEITGGYFCKEHANELYEMLNKKENIVLDADWRHHCHICGEYKNRIIIGYRPIGYYCDIDIREEMERYHQLDIKQK